MPLLALRQSSAFLRLQGSEFHPHIRLFLQARLAIRRCTCAPRSPSSDLSPSPLSYPIPCTVTYSFLPLGNLGSHSKFLLEMATRSITRRREGMGLRGERKVNHPFSDTGCPVVFGSWFFMCITVTSPARFCTSMGQGPWHFLPFCLFGRKSGAY